MGVYKDLVEILRVRRTVGYIEVYKDYVGFIYRKPLLFSATGG